MIIHQAPKSFDPGAMLRDIASGFVKYDIWSTFAWDEIQKRFRRSRLGFAWILISYLLFVSAIGIFFGGFARAETDHFLMYVAIGYATFMFIIANLIDGCEVFSGSSTWIKSSSLPYSVYVYKSICRSLFIFVLNLSVALVMMVLMGWHPTVTAWLALPAIAIYLVNAVWIQYLFGLIAARSRDMSHLMQSVTRLLFFTTPILWIQEERTGLAGTLSNFNPITHYIDIFRAPLLGTTGHWESWATVGGFTISGILITLLFGAVHRRRLPFWI